MALMGRVCGLSLVTVVALGQAGTTGQTGQTAKSKSASAAKPGMAVWSPEVQQTLGVSAENFNAEGLNKLTKMQLVALEASARIDPRKQILTCPAGGMVPGGRIHVLITVAGDDPTGSIATALRQSVGSLSAVDVVDSAAQSDRVLHVVIEKLTTGRGTIGFAASYLTGTPCLSEPAGAGGATGSAGKKTDVELKGTLGAETAVKEADLVKDLTGLLDHDLEALRPGTPR
jgi:hypothetical protein